jgi:hypothetical protein
MSDRRAEARSAIDKNWWPDSPHADALRAILDTLDDVVARVAALEDKAKKNK